MMLSDNDAWLTPEDPGDARAGSYGYRNYVADKAHMQRRDRRLIHFAVGACCSECASSKPVDEWTVGAACCAECEAAGKTCQAYEVGRSFPASEIADHDARVEQLRDEVVHHDSKSDSPQDQTNWATLLHKIEGYRLRWGMWKRGFQDSAITWWGTDDETEFTTLRNEYNSLLKEVKGFTHVTVTAPPAETPPGLKENEDKKRDSLFGVIPSWVLPTVIGAGVLIAVAPSLVGVAAMKLGKVAV